MRGRIQVPFWPSRSLPEQAELIDRLIELGQRATVVASAINPIPAAPGLQVHHLVPVSWGGSDDLANLAAVCPAHHAQLVPHGEWTLEGNPHQPDGLHLARSTRQMSGAGARAGP